MEPFQFIKNSIRSIPDFPAPGIMFRDLTTLMIDPVAFRMACECLEDASHSLGSFDLIAGIESRGFVFGGALASMLGKGLVPIRKPGKLPAEVLSEDYELEYGTDTMEVHRDAVKKGLVYLVLDDLLATGGTAEAACRLIEKGGGSVAGCLFLVELQDLKGREKLINRNVVSIVKFEGE